MFLFVARCVLGSGLMAFAPRGQDELCDVAGLLVLPGTLL